MEKRAILWLLAFTLGSCSYSGEVLFAEGHADWETHGTAHWTFQGDTLVGAATDAEGFVMTRGTYSNFILDLEFKPDSSINSGIFIRCTECELSAEDCYEINIWDLHPTPKWRTGAIVLRETPLAHVNTLNRWNTYRIAAGADTLRIWVNDTLTALIPDPELTEGYIGLQASGTGEIRFRNVRLYR